MNGLEAIPRLTPHASSGHHLSSLTLGVPETVHPGVKPDSLAAIYQ